MGTAARPAAAAVQGRMHRLLAALGEPHLRWPAVHVAGTKGKGSTSAMLSAMLQQADYRVGTYTRQAAPSCTQLRLRTQQTGGQHSIAGSSGSSRGSDGHCTLAAAVLVA